MRTDTAVIENVDDLGERVARDPASVVGFVEQDGFVSIEAEHFTSAASSDVVRWKRLPDLGRTLSAMTALPRHAPSETPGGQSPRLEYQMVLSTPGPIQVRAHLSPTLNYHTTGLRYAVSFDDQPPQTVNLHTDAVTQAEPSRRGRPGGTALAHGLHFLCVLEVF